MIKTATSKNLWSVKVAHRQYESLWILASTAEKAVQKALAFSKKEDGVSRAIVKRVESHGTIDVF